MKYLHSRLLHKTFQFKTVSAVILRKMNPIFIKTHNHNQPTCKEFFSYYLQVSWL